MPRPIPRLLSGSEPFLLPAGEDFAGAPALTVLDFWRWSMSDLVSNTARGVLAEFLVGSALGIASGTRVEWVP
ncbi:MAG: hypothetical protein IPG17_26280 [Sandaracinaceae bacterium]|nr:hypothetical protein [Sandaracinaceae bacterium]